AAVLLNQESIPTRKTSKRERLKRLGARYWQQLMRVGVPQQDAKEIAIAVVRFNQLDCRPSFKEKRLIGRYCQHLGAVGLWHLEMLLGS
ncbi:MAG: hypothetical protein F6K11_24295, partial [Leptolyngbya sp. SIO3F4]|nr:hypothetical protein [Leptolyngbya sp. SIO3F4]